MDDLEADELPVADEARTFEDPSPAHQRMLKSTILKLVQFRIPGGVVVGVFFYCHVIAVGRHQNEDSVEWEECWAGL